MKIINAVSEDGQILVEYEVAGRTRKRGFPIDSSDEFIKAELEAFARSMEKIEGRKEETAENLKNEEEAQKTIKSLLK